MDNFSAGRGRQPARQWELHGPWMAPLTVRKESRKIKKPPVTPLPPQQQYRQPVIIYTASPKVIHTTPADFMSVVQSLTGGQAPSASDGNRGPAPYSPAASFAAFEKTATSPSASARTLKREEVDDVAVEVISSPEQRRGGGILSPGPAASLPWISPAIFTPTAILTPPAIQFVMSPNSNLLFSGTGMVPSPTAYWDLFRHYQH